MHRLLPLLALVVLVLAGCRDKDDTTETGTPATDSGVAVDADDDGWPSDEDCDDTDPLVNPGAEEVCNETDDDCDEAVDEGLTRTWYADSDDDGYGDPGETDEACEAPSGYVEDATDCDDGNADIHPDAVEVCNDLDDD